MGELGDKATNSGASLSYGEQTEEPRRRTISVRDGALHHSEEGRLRLEVHRDHIHVGCFKVTFEAVDHVYRKAKLQLISTRTMASLVDFVLEGVVTIRSIKRSWYGLYIFGKPAGDRKNKRDAEMLQAEWQTSLSAIVIRTANQCAKIAEQKGCHEAAAAILESAYSELEKLGIHD